MKASLKVVLLAGPASVSFHVWGYWTSSTADTHVSAVDGVTETLVDFGGDGLSKSQLPSLHLAWPRGDLHFG